jgi:hypothetical protein
MEAYFRLGEEKIMVVIPPGVDEGEGIVEVEAHCWSNWSWWHGAGWMDGVEVEVLRLVEV